MKKTEIVAPDQSYNKLYGFNLMYLLADTVVFVKLQLFFFPSANFSSIVYCCCLFVHLFAAATIVDGNWPGFGINSVDNWLLDNCQIIVNVNVLHLQYHVQLFNCCQQLLMTIVQLLMAWICNYPCSISSLQSTEWPGIYLHL